MNNDLTNATKEVITALKPLAQRLGESASAIYQLAVKDAVITGKIEVWVCAFLAFMVFMGFVLIIMSAVTKSKELIGPGIFMVFIFGVALLVVGSDCAHNLYNPEYMALKSLLAQIK